MAGSLISNFMMFLPERTKWFCLIGLCVFVFGIYIPYDKYKNKKKQTKKAPPKQKPVSKPADRKQTGQLDALKKAGLLTEEEYRERIRKLQKGEEV